MGKRLKKRGRKGDLFWTIFMFILIVFAFLFFYTNLFEKNQIEQVNLGKENAIVNISDVKIRYKGIDFTLNAYPKREEIAEVEFIFETKGELSETYEQRVSYLPHSYTQDFFSIDLKEINPNRIKRILITPVVR